MNKVILVGRIAREVEIKTTPGGRNYSFNAVACKRDYKNKDGKYDSDFIPLTFGDITSTFLGKYVQKGDMVEVIGRWNTRKDENNYAINECFVESINIVEKSYVNKQPKDDSPFEEDEPKNLDTKLGNNPTMKDVEKEMVDLPEGELPF